MKNSLELLEGIARRRSLPSSERKQEPCFLYLSIKKFFVTASLLPIP